MEIFGPTKRRAVFGVFRGKSEVNTVLQRLLASGYSSKDITVLPKDMRGRGSLTNPQRTSILAGVRLGAIIGGVLALFAALTVGVQATSVETASRVWGALASVSLVSLIVLGGAVLGAACGALVGIGTPPNLNDRYADDVSDGGILVSIHIENPNEAQAVSERLEKLGALDVSYQEERMGWRSVYESLFHPSRASQ